MNRIVTMDTVYAGVPAEFETRMNAAIASSTGQTAALTLESHRREFEAWELGTWSTALEREFAEQTEVQDDGSIRYRRRLPDWQAVFIRDMEAGLYFETAIRRPALILVARDLDLNRVRRLPREWQGELLPLARTIGESRKRQIQDFKRNGSHVKVRWMSNASHYLFVDRARETSRLMVDFLKEQSR